MCSRNRTYCVTYPYPTALLHNVTKGKKTKKKKNSIGVNSNQKKTRSYKICALSTTPNLAGQRCSPTHGICAPFYLAVYTGDRTVRT